jgi:hypothetical protein
MCALQSGGSPHEDAEYRLVNQGICAVKSQKRRCYHAVPRRRKSADRPARVWHAHLTADALLTGLRENVNPYANP